MDNQSSKPCPWYKRLENYGGILTGLSTILTLFSPNTLAYKAGIAIGGILTMTGLRNGYQANNLPSGITQVMDQIPDKITGVKGSATSKN